jgi:hypothetical protein
MDIPKVNPLKPNDPDMQTNNNDLLIRTLLDCASACEMCATACLSEDDVTPMAACIKLDRDCADICRLAAALLQRDSKLAHQLLLLCEEICRMCGDECKKHSQMTHCKECAEACLACAEACHANHEFIQQK